MCGIFGYIGSDNLSVQKTLRALKDLDYRGYDSWGVAAKNGRKFFIRKEVGKVADIDEKKFKGVKSGATIGHTRWATHGGVSRINTHPHFNKDKTIAVVHNGIIENYAGLKKELEKRHGRLFVSKTDTEVIPHLIDSFRKRGLSQEQAVRKTCLALKGRFAFVVLFSDSDFLLAARDGSPLVLTSTDDGSYIASDTTALVDYTDTVSYFENGEYARITPDKIIFYNFKTGRPVLKRPEKISWEKAAASKAGYAHFMLKEILEQREFLSDAISLGEAEVKKSAPLFKQAQRVFFTAMGTAAHMGMMGEYFLSRIGKCYSRLVYASEFDFALPFLGTKSVVCGITQSGETADLLEAFKIARRKRAKIVSVINVRDSSAERESKVAIPVNAGPEKAVASTKAATAQFFQLAFLAYAISGKTRYGKQKLKKAAAEIRSWLSKRLLSKIERISGRIKDQEDLYVIGKGINYPIALEAALKIKEVSYIHAEGFAAGELKHGTIALIEEGTPCVALVSNDEYKDDVLGNVAELKSRGAYIVGVAPFKHNLFDEWIEIPDLGDLTAAAHMISSQVLAYYLSVLRGHDPDKPRNLAKSVTVK